MGLRVPSWVSGHRPQSKELLHLQAVLGIVGRNAVVEERLLVYCMPGPQDNHPPAKSLCRPDCGEPDLHEDAKSGLPPSSVRGACCGTR